MKIPTIGADPEFGFLNAKGNVMQASNLINASYRFGLDGCSTIAEIRPVHSKEPRQLVENIRNLLIDGAKRNPNTKNYKWKAGAEVQGFPIGGHVHFGTRGMNRDRLVFHLESYAGVVIRLLENEEEVISRQNEGYGNRGDYRSNGHGIEWRSPSSWLTTPRIAEGFLCLCHATAIESINNRSLPILQVGCTCEEVEEDDWEEEARSDKDLFPVVKLAVRRFKAYKKYKIPIEFLFQLVAKKKSYFTNFDMKQEWGIEKKVFLSKEKISSLHLKDIWTPGKKGRR